MKLPTDTELRDRYTSAQRLRALSPAEADRMIDLIRLEWTQLLAEKRKGELTDKIGVELLDKETKSASIMYGITIAREYEPAGHDKEFYPAFWRYVCRTTDQAISREAFDKFVREVTAEVQSIRNDVLTADEQGRYSLTFSGIHKGQPVWIALWKMNAWIWRGPSR